MDLELARADLFAALAGAIMRMDFRGTGATVPIQGLREKASTLARLCSLQHPFRKLFLRQGSLARVPNGNDRDRLCGFDRLINDDVAPEYDTSEGRIDPAQEGSAEVREVGQRVDSIEQLLNDAESDQAMRQAIAQEYRAMRRARASSWETTRPASTSAKPR